MILSYKVVEILVRISVVLLVFDVVFFVDFSSGIKSFLFGIDLAFSFLCGATDANEVLDFVAHGNDRIGFFDPCVDFGGDFRRKGLVI